ncbi:MAG: NAD(P)/FAD-dependent oxidoreductase [Acidobacteria bacterium]|nr:NAD(P)/FAD-dependent oxidoreductase [Acidobacteriota bacterium]
MMTDRPRVVVVGGGFAGLAAVRALAGALVEVVVVDRYNHHVFQPLLYQVATAGLSPADIAAPIRWILRRQANVRVLLDDVVAVQAGEHRLELASSGPLAYDYLVVATGVTHAYFGHDQWAAHAPGLKTLDDAVAIRRRVLVAFEEAEREADEGRQRDLLTFVVIGGGPTGVEMAGAIAEIARQALADEFDAVAPETSRVLLLEGGPTILSSYGDRLRTSAREALASLGVEVRESTIVTDVGEGMVHIGDETIRARTIVWAAGVQASPVGRQLGGEIDRLGRVKVAPDLSVPAHSEIFVAGDLMIFTGADGQSLPGVAQVAMQSGRRAAHNILARLQGRPTVPFTYRNLGNMATIGRARAVADLGWVSLTGYPAWLAWLFLHLVFLVGFKNRMVVLVQWLVAYLTRQRGVRLITGDRR